ncbi:DUF2922 domain-containing protein [Clostridium folliculivorans]|uniref:DUF2922 domain-containing protein n=1 Tax=Clostridium folliculivorans TaxID=2886038 RepID=A0A9W6D9R8_9CLOT|nr:DUF2922 domain-containing protein [Clostridium folliculivorans]GKU24062.1 hypothetical protein CFOLD11_08880 [Clostridium folliculivorans]GKU30175.1 hypothetical protein CFB3_22820 [Clostridium folliculivorans]
MVTKYLVLAFKNESGDKINLSLKGIKDNLTAEEISKAMDVIISKNAFFSSGGKLIQKSGAQIITKNVDDYKVG